MRPRGGGDRPDGDERLPVVLIVAVVGVVLAAAVVLLTLRSVPGGDTTAPAPTTGGTVSGGPGTTTPEPPTTTPLVGPPSATAPRDTVPLNTVPPDEGPVGSPEVFPSPGDPTTPAPYIQPFAQLPGATPQPPLPGPPVSSPLLVGIDGCDRRYGSVVQCIPATFPPGVTDRCTWLGERGFGPLPVHGEDGQGLDPNGDGTACGSDD